MDTKNKTNIMFCTLSWIFCAIGILVRPFSKIGWAISFAGQIVCLAVVLIICISTIIQIKKEQKIRDRLIEENIKHMERIIDAWLEQHPEYKEKTETETSKEIKLQENYYD